LQGSEEIHSKVFSSVPQSQKQQILEIQAPPDVLVHQFQTTESNDLPANAYHTAEEYGQSHPNHNVTLNLNLSNYPGSMMLVNNESTHVSAQMEIERRQHLPTFQSSVETLEGIADGFGDKKKAVDAYKMIRTESGR